MPAEPRGPRPALLWGLGAGVAVLAVITVVVLLGGPDEDPVAQGSDEPTIAPTQTQTATPEPTETPSPTQAPTSEPSPTPSEPSETPSPTEPAEREPTNADAEQFASANQPADQVTTGDVTGDGVDEVVVARVRNHSAQIVVGSWDGRAYVRTFTDSGGSASKLEALEITDYNGEPGGEIVTTQAVGEAGRSISVWGRARDEVQRQEANGGCWDGSHTYGVDGATIEQGRITASCDTSPLPGQFAPRDVYEWRRKGWTYTKTTTPEG